MEYHSVEGLRQQNWQSGAINTMATHLGVEIRPPYASSPIWSYNTQSPPGYPTFEDWQRQFHGPNTSFEPCQLEYLSRSQKESIYHHCTDRGLHFNPISLHQNLEQSRCQSGNRVIAYYKKRFQIFVTFFLYIAGFIIWKEHFFDQNIGNREKIMLPLMILGVGYLKENLTSNNDLLLNGTLFDVRCCECILNLIVQDGLKVIDSVCNTLSSSTQCCPLCPTGSRLCLCLPGEDFPGGHLFM
ncbi:hypothetical protein OSB04_011174 [Centaurea solstitialis]|uniref:Uncharacterized protein n=1 Tax=Centaurea solstitialis TaxID=347529 RepID=A0AA38T8X7_9ASTR|nr:hypothetical protein OSB04_011174 [Centaurea solstitialis]